MNPPVDEEAWSHAATPELLEEHFDTYIPLRDARRKLRRQLTELYRYRIAADYRGSGLARLNVSEARKYSNRLVNQMRDILPKG